MLHLLLKEARQDPSSSLQETKLRFTFLDEGQNSRRQLLVQNARKKESVKNDTVTERKKGLTTECIS